MIFRYGEDELTVGKALAISRGTMTTEFSQATLKRLHRAYKVVRAVAGKTRPTYGINTGFGPLCNVKIDAGETVALQRKLLLSHSVGVGEPISIQLTKLMMILKIHALCRGYSGIAPHIIVRLVWHLENEVIPVVPEQGSVGASGDLAPLSHLFLPLIGEGEVFHRGKRRPAAAVLREHGLEPVALHPKAGLALINGTQFMLAHAVLLVERLHNALENADLIAALMVEGLQASAMPFHPALHATRPFRGIVHVAARIHRFLEDSEIVQAHANCDRVQDPYSLRCVPQVHGASRNAWLHLKEMVETEMNSVTDNPVVFNEKLIISGGSFHGQPLALPLDYACLAAAEIGSISDRRSYFALHGIPGVVPKLLIEKSGLDSGLMIVQYTSAALVSENKTMCFPASADSIPTSLGQEDHVSMGSISGRKALRVVRNLEKILGVELFCAAQAFDFRRPLRSSPTLEAVHARIRQDIAYAADDRIYARDLEAATDLVRLGVLNGIVENHQTGPYGEYDHLFKISPAGVPV
jgi:histidine ammonia-lyase